MHLHDPDHHSLLLCAEDVHSGDLDYWLEELGFRHFEDSEESAFSSAFAFCSALPPKQSSPPNSGLPKQLPERGVSVLRGIGGRYRAQMSVYS